MSVYGYLEFAHPLITSDLLLHIHYYLLICTSSRLQPCVAYSTTSQLLHATTRVAYLLTLQLTAYNLLTTSTTNNLQLATLYSDYTSRKYNYNLISRWDPTFERSWWHSDLWNSISVMWRCFSCFFRYSRLYTLCLNHPQHLVLLC